MSLSSLSTEAATTVDRVVEELRRALFDGDVTPGTPLREVALADSLGVSRPTVREALGTLVGEGLADRIAHRGTVVRQLDAAAIEDICRTRLVVEGAGIRAWGTASEQKRVAVRASLDAFAALPHDSTSAQSTAAHLAIHRSIVALTGSDRVLAAADGLYAELRLALATVDRVRRNLPDQVTSHSTLVDVVETGDTDVALAELGSHLEDARISLLGQRLG